MNRLSIRIKLVLLAGVPVLGALVLAGIIAVGVRRQAEAAGALGSFDDVAQLTAHMSVARRALQLERANVALREGVAARPGADPGVRNKAAPALAQQYTGTDAALDSLDQFLDGRALSRLPPRLARGSRVARSSASACARTARSSTTSSPSTPRRPRRCSTRRPALTELSDDGKLLRPISSLVALGELTERESLEHALLAYVFASTQFPPGSYKTLVTVATEQSIYENAFRSNAADAIVREYDAAEASSDATAAIAMSAKALATTDEILDFDVREWFERESGRLARQYAIEDEILAAVASAASAKMEAARTSTRTSFALSSFVLLASALLAWTIGRGVIRTVIALSSAAALVRRTKDYSIRAPKTSADELGALTDAF